MNTPQSAAARRYFIRLIWMSLALSVAGNAVHALPGVAGQVGVKIVLGVLPPILLALLIHGMGHLVEAGLSGRLYRVATTAVAALAVAAGAVSFVALRELALAAGWAPALAWLAPVIVDVPVVVGTAAVVAVDRAAMRQSVTVPDPASAHGGEVEVDTAPTVAPDPAPSTEVAVEPEATRDMAPRDMAPPAHPKPKPQPRRAQPAPRRAPGASSHLTPLPVDDAAVRRLAQQVVASGRTAADADVVAQVLARLSGGESGRAVGAATGISEAAVRRIKTAAAEVADEPQLVSA
ncbi:DUF2637 domain-containing protein [Gordonia sp. UBA7599]|uniref:DUF2637 domain-containing protein n=1 Tax=unclassified Gordonia (in: high G+C Gram-positive bacteria) TaxID=2657482 RepID=UPI0025C5AD7E|nr:DUF2637 domain-containing protein [Gordonia sp. UBA7599]HNP58814.1 DUF2637 domain-containing protein [Gordonia sp. (in: high G+C Gram-positive bacteria)]